MDKKVFIITSDDQRGVENVIFDYLKENFRETYREIEIEKFGYLGDFIDSYKKHRRPMGKSGEIFIIFDRRLYIRSQFGRTYKPTIQEQMIRTLFNMIKREYDKEKVPYIKYEGEIERRDGDSLIRKLDEIKDLISVRLEYLESLDSFAE